MRLLILTLLLAPVIAGAGPLDEALALVQQQSATVQAKELEARAVAKQSDWAAKVRVGYALQGTDTSAAGVDAGLTVEIPLFSRETEIAAAKAHAAKAEASDRVMARFLGEVAKLHKLVGDRAEAEEMAAFYLDRLEYFKRAVEEGKAASDTLWSDAEKAKKAEHDALQHRAEYAALMDETARVYGGSEWRRLAALLAAHLHRTGP